MKGVLRVSGPFSISSFYLSPGKARLAWVVRSKDQNLIQ